MEIVAGAGAYTAPPDGTPNHFAEQLRRFGGAQH